MSTNQHADPLIGRLVDGRYRVRARIARGGMATVYVATDLRLERRIALKIMHSHLSDDTVFQSRFVQEARSAARLADPHVVNVFDQGQDGDMAYLVMEYLPGITLRELLREQRRLTIPQAITIMDAILSGLAAAHRAGIIHRDVKPENVLLAEDGRIKIGDFGLARATSAHTASGAQLLGTIAYLAPELVTRGTADARSDIYSLGIMLYEMLTGEQAYKGEQPMQIAFQHATESVPRPSVKNPGVPEQLDELVLWATEKTPDDRPSDAREMLDRLREIERDLGIAPEVARTLSASMIRDEQGALGSGDLTQVLPATMTAPTATVIDDDNAARLRLMTRRRMRKGLFLMILVLLLAVIAGGAGWWFGSGPGSQVSVPDVSERSFNDAQQLLAELSLSGTQKDVYDLNVAPGIVVNTVPGAGTQVDKESKIEVLVSAGPQPHDVQTLLGLDAAEARRILTANNLTVTDDEQYFTDAPEGAVLELWITPRAGGEAHDCSAGCTVLEGDAATLSVSVGLVPDVSGQTVDAATATLAAKNLNVAETIEEFSNDIEEGLVIRLDERDGGGSWRPGDRVRLIASKGPEPVEVPDVVGMSIRNAVIELEDRGFEINPGIEDGDLPLGFKYWDVYSVKATNPKPGKLAPPGSTITLTPGL